MSKNYKYLSIILILFIVFAGGSNHLLNAQHEKNKNKGYELVDHLWYGLNVGNIGIGGNTFSAGVAPMGGYKFTDYFGVGLTTKFNYTYFWQQFGDNYHFFDYGGGVLARVKLFKQKYFAQVEYDYMNISNFNGIGKTSDWYPFFYVGGGINYPGNGNWSSNLSILLNVHPESSSLFFPLNFSYGFLYNF